MPMTERHVYGVTVDRKLLGQAALVRDQMSDRVEGGSRYNLLGNFRSKYEWGPLFVREIL